MQEKRKILVASSTPELYRDLFPGSRYEAPVLETSAGAIKRRLMKESFSMILIGGPLIDEAGIRTAAEISAIHQVPILLLIKKDSFDQAVYQLKDQNVFVLSLPLNRSLVLQAISFMEKSQDQMKKLQIQLQKEKQKRQEEKMISLCKLRLIENYHWSEEKAHSYIGKAAMDHSTTRVNVARVLLNKMEAKMSYATS